MTAALRVEMWVTPDLKHGFKLLHEAGDIWGEINGGSNRLSLSSRSHRGLKLRTQRLWWRGSKVVFITGRVGGCYNCYGRQLRFFFVTALMFLKHIILL